MNTNAKENNVWKNFLVADIAGKVIGAFKDVFLGIYFLKITQGSIKRSIMNNAIAIGVSIAVGMSIYRVTTGISINNFLLVGYILAMILMIFTPDIFTMVAFDSGGAVTGPMTTTFLLPLIIGICYACNGNVLTDAFGLVALVAMSPLLTIQILGIIYNLKSRKTNNIDTIDESIVEFERRKQHE